MGQKWETDVGCDLWVNQTLSRRFFEAAEGRGSANSTRELVPAMDHSVTEEVVSGSCPTVPLLEFELVSSGHRAVIW